MDGSEFPVSVTGFWRPEQNRTVRKKLEVYFQNKRKSEGGECRVEVEDEAPRARVVFFSQAVRDQVLAKESHDVTVDGQTVELQLLLPSSPADVEVLSESSSNLEAQRSKVKLQCGASAAEEEPAPVQTGDLVSDQSVAVVMDNVPGSMSSDLLSMLVENIAGIQDESSYSLELIHEDNRAVVSFCSRKDAERFLTLSPKNSKFQSFRLRSELLDPTDSVRVEGLSPAAIKDMLELYFQKSWVAPVNVVMIPEQQAALVTFADPKVVRSICSKEDHVMRSTPIKVYPYYKSLRTALYGKDRPAFRMPEPFTEAVHQAVWKFLVMKNQQKSINDHMQPFFCAVDLDQPEAKLKPLPSFLRQKGLTGQQVDKWKSNAQERFRQLMDGYTVFECLVNAAVWNATEKDLRSFVKNDAYLMHEASRGSLIVACHGTHVKQIRGSLEDAVRKATSRIERQTNSVSEVMDLSPAEFHILKQEGLQKFAQGISPELVLNYNDSAKKLTISGLAAEVFKTKSWILQANLNMSNKTVNVKPSVLDFLKTAAPMDLFTSHRISAFYSIVKGQVRLTASCDTALADAEKRLNVVLCQQVLDVKDQEVLKLPNWTNLNKSLLDTYNSIEKVTVLILLNTDKITVVGFENPVKEVSLSLKDFMEKFSRVQQSVHVGSLAVAEFIEKKKEEEWSSIAKANQVRIQFNAWSPRITLSGPNVHVQEAKACLKNLTQSLYTDNFIVNKPGAKKYFLSHGGVLLSTALTDFKCVVVLRPENEEEEEETEEAVLVEATGSGETEVYCKVKTAGGVLVSVGKVDICSLQVDAVVNAANEDLRHIGGVALALRTAAGPQLQKVCDDFINKNGPLKPGDAVLTDSFDLPAKYVVHAVGPRFTDFNKKTAVSRLQLSVKESLRQAEKVECRTVALPAISSGVFGFPIDLCCETIAQAVREYCDSLGRPGSLTEVHLVDNKAETVRNMAGAVDREFRDLGPTMMTIPQHGAGMTSRGSHPGRGGHQSPSPTRPEFVEKGHKGEAGGPAAGPQRGGQSYPVRQEGGRSQGGLHGRPAQLGRAEQTTAEGLKIVLCSGNIQDQTTDVIVNTISENLNLDLGAVSKAILQAAGPKLQSAVRAAAGKPMMKYGQVTVTDGFKLKCQKVFHTVCPFWDNGSGSAEKMLESIVRFCLDEAESCHLRSLSFPALGTGTLGFPKDVVSRILLQEIHASSRKRPKYLKEVDIVIHPSDSQTLDCFTKEFKGQPLRNVPHVTQILQESPVQPSVSQSQQSSASFGRVSSPSLGLYQMQMGQLTLEVSSGDITKETSDVIVNSSNQNFDLRIGVSKAILDAAGEDVERECRIKARDPQMSMWIQTSAGQLPCGSIIHIVGQKDPENIKGLVYTVLKVCEEQKHKSVSFPALGTGQGGASPSMVADAMVDAVADFVRKKHPKFVRKVKILIFQTSMIGDFTDSMKRQQGQDVEEKGVFSKFKDTVTSWFMGSTEQQPPPQTLHLDELEFEPAVFQLCSDSPQAVTRAKRRIEDLIIGEQADRTIRDPYVGQLSSGDMEELNALQRRKTISISLRMDAQDQEPSIYLEGLTRDITSTEFEVRDILQKVKDRENLKMRALQMATAVEWQYGDPSGTMVTFDMYTNLTLEDALCKKENVRIKINNVLYVAKMSQRRAYAVHGRKEMELFRNDLKGDAVVPGHWEDMKGDFVKLVTLNSSSNEFQDVEQEVQKTGLQVNIRKIKRVQNETLWKNYQIMKKLMDNKNTTTNNERRLFHGTSASSLDLINKQNFNRGYAGTHAAIYGKGTYFAVDPAYSAQRYAPPDQKGHKYMYLARVLVGEYTKGNQSMITPPSKPSGIPADLYDSVTDNVANPTMFVTFNDNQAYPEHLIVFT